MVLYQIPPPVSWHLPRCEEFVLRPGNTIERPSMYSRRSTPPRDRLPKQVKTIEKTHRYALRSVLRSVKEETPLCVFEETPWRVFEVSWPCPISK